MQSGLPKRLDILGRRSRFKRQPTGKRTVLTIRDIEIFRLLWRYRYLSSDRIVSHFNPGSPNRLKERLGDLFHETHHINRPPAQWRRARAEQFPSTYELTKIGLEAYADAEAELTLPSPAVSFGGAINRRILQFNHAQQISEVLFDIEQLSMGSQTKRLVIEHDILEKASAKLKRKIEHTKLDVAIPKSKFMPLQKAPFKTQIVPDALFGIEHIDGKASTYRFYALEVERKNPTRRGTLEKPSALKKLLAYKALLKANTLRKQLSLPHLHLIIAAETPEKLLKIMGMADEIWSKDQQSFLLFAPPEQLRQSSSDKPDPYSPFMEITKKWFEHFQP